MRITARLLLGATFSIAPVIVAIGAMAPASVDSRTSVAAASPSPTVPATAALSSPTTPGDRARDTTAILIGAARPTGTPVPDVLAEEPSRRRGATISSSASAVPNLTAVPATPIAATTAVATMGPTIVADPRVGDLRADPAADTLPVSYRPPTAATVRRGVAYGEDPAQRIDLHLPEQLGAPVIVYLHAGGWVAGGPHEVPDIILRFVERGFAVASVGYRLAPEHPFPAPVDDVRNALRFLTDVAGTDGTIDTDRLVLAGASAGAHLATLVAATDGATSTTIDALVAMVGPSDLTTFVTQDHRWARPLTEAFLGCSPCGPEVMLAASPTTHLHYQLPPAYFAYGAQDSLVDLHTQGQRIATAWAQASGASNTLLDVVDDRGHNLDVTSINQRALEAFIELAVGRD